MVVALGHEILNSANMDKTAFNVTGFIQPAFVYEMLNQVPDADGLNDRQLFDFPPERELLLDELVVPMPPDTPDLLKLFLSVYKNHKENHTYTLEGEFYSEYRKLHDRLVSDKLRSNNEDVQGILSKARGYCARIAMVIHSLEQALESIATSSPTPHWDCNVSHQAIKAASMITEHFNQQKFIMLGIDRQNLNVPRSHKTLIHRHFVLHRQPATVKLSKVLKIKKSS